MRSARATNRFCHTVPALIAATAMKAAVSVGAVTPAASPSLGDSTIATPARPIATPAQ
jgi:hypothetical protein